MPWFGSPSAQRWTIDVMFRDSGPTGFGANVNAAPRLPGTPGVWKPFQVAVASSHPSVTWYAVWVFPSLVILSPRLAFTMREPAGISPDAGPIIEGNLIRLLQTPPGGLQPTASMSNMMSDPKFVFGRPSEM